MRPSMEIHERVLVELSAVEFRGEALTLMRAAALSAFSFSDGPKTLRTTIPPEIQHAICAVFSLTAALGHPRKHFEMELRNSLSVLHNLQPTTDPFNVKIIAALRDYTTHLSVFRSTWSLLFNATGSEYVPPHMFAVRWMDLRREDILQSIRALQSSASHTLASIESGDIPFLGYFIYILQYVHTVRVTLLECIGEIFLNSADCVDVLTIVRYMYSACVAQRELSAQQSLWRKFSVLTSDFFTQCARFDDQQILSIGASDTDAAPAPCPQGQIDAQCPFFFILQRVLSGLHARLTLLFSCCLSPSLSLSLSPPPLSLSPPLSRSLSLAPSPLAPPPPPPTPKALGPERPAAAPPAPTAEGRARRHTTTKAPTGAQWRAPDEAESGAPSGSQWRGPAAVDSALMEYVARHRGAGIGRAMSAAARHERHRVSLMLVTDCTRRPGRRTWRGNRYTVANAIRASINNKSNNGGGGVEDDDDDATRRQGFAHWVLNFVIPRVLPAEEQALLRALVFQAASATSHRLRFVLTGMVFYVLRSDSTMDGGRMHFALILHIDEPGAAEAQGEALEREEAIGREEAHWAFCALEELCAVWSLHDMCNLAVQADSRGIVSVN